MSRFRAQTLRPLIDHLFISCISTHEVCVSSSTKKEAVFFCTVIRLRTRAGGFIRHGTHKRARNLCCHNNLSSSASTLTLKGSHNLVQHLSRVSVCDCRWCKGKNVKWSRYRPSVAQRVGRGIALLFHDRGTRRWWVVSSMPRLHINPEKDPVPILQNAGWAPGPVWTGEKSSPHRDPIPDRSARGQWLPVVYIT